MKIESNRLAGDTEGAEALKRAANDRTVRRGVVPPSPAATDRVEVSADAQLLNAALDAAQRTPAIRADLVERVRQKLEAGEIGRDSAKLADRLIDHLLGR